MKIRHIVLSLAGSWALICTGAMAASSGKTTYKWIDKDGVVQYGDTVPPEYSNQAHQKLNQQGVPVHDYPRQLSPTEAAAAQKAATDDTRRRQHDSYLLNNYTKAGDIEQLRDERVALIDGQMELARTSIASADQRIGGLRGRLGAFKPYSTAPAARRVPDQLAEEVVRALSERRSMSTQLEQRGKERAEQLDSFNTDIARYKELTSRPASR